MRMRAGAALHVVVQQGEDVVARQPFPSLQKIQFHYECEAGDFAAEAFGELRGGDGGASGGEKIVDDEDALAFLDGVLVDLKSVGAVFEVIADLGGGGGEFAGLADGNESGVEAVG
jgi:hypothetical protein